MRIREVLGGIYVIITEEENELVSKYSIKSFNNNIINYRIIFNGSPKKFLEIAQENGVFINTTEQVWLLK